MRRSIRSVNGGSTPAGAPNPQPALLDALGPEAAADLCGRGTVRRFPRGATLMLEGDFGRTVFLLREGRVKVSAHSYDGREVLLNVHGPGEAIGLIAAFDEAPRTATVTCLEPCVAVAVDVADVRAFTEERPGAAYELLRAVCRLFRYTNQRQIDLSALDVLGRVAAQLADLAMRFGEPAEPPAGAIRIGITVTHEQLASAVGTSREAVGKAVQRLQKLDLVAHRRRELTVLDLDGLVEHAR
jgi:CRP/FNR family transcriptional regulator, cyclic AMP receptor protein